MLARLNEGSHDEAPVPEEAEVLATAFVDRFEALVDGRDAAPRESILVV